MLCKVSYSALSVQVWCICCYCRQQYALLPPLFEIPICHLFLLCRTTQLFASAALCLVHVFRGNSLGASPDVAKEAALLPVSLAGRTALSASAKSSSSSTSRSADSNSSSSSITMSANSSSSTSSSSSSNSITTSNQPQPLHILLMIVEWLALDPEFDTQVTCELLTVLMEGTRLLAVEDPTSWHVLPFMTAQVLPADTAGALLQPVLHLLAPAMLHLLRASGAATGKDRKHVLWVYRSMLTELVEQGKHASQHSMCVH